MLNFRKGEVMYVDFPYAAAIAPERHGDVCAWCFKKHSDECYLCEKCLTATYCSTRCQVRSYLVNIFRGVSFQPRFANPRVPS